MDAYMREFQELKRANGNEIKTQILPQVDFQTNSNCESKLNS